MEKTHCMGFKILDQYQVHKETLLNENFKYLDVLLSCGILSRQILALPENPQSADKYILPLDLEYSKLIRKNTIAIFTGEWHFIEPRAGMLYWILDEKMLVVFDGKNWVDVQNPSPNSVPIG